MSSGTLVNYFQQLAAQLPPTGASSTEEQRLFQQAVDFVCSKSKNETAVNIVAQLRQARQPDDVTQLFNKWREANTLWQRQAPDSWTRRLARISDTFLKYKTFGDALIKLNQSIAAPVWGVLCASLSVAKGLLDTDENLDLAEEALEVSFDHISTIFIPGHDLPQNLEDAITRLYRIAVEFSVRVAIIFQETVTKSVASTVTHKLNDELVKFSKSFKNALESIDRAMKSESRRDMKAIHDILAFPTYPQASTIRNTPIWFFPSMLSASFVGRRYELYMLRRNLTLSVHYRKPSHFAVIGAGGVGKSQTVLQFIDAHILRNPVSHDTSVIFVHAQSRAAIFTAFSMIAEEIGVSNNSLSDAQPMKLIRKVQLWLESAPGWIMVFDNVCDSNDLLDFVPNSGNGHVLITTRSLQVANAWTKPENILHMDPLGDNDGKELVFKLVPKEVNPNSVLEQNAASEIVKLSGGIPLVIEQVVKNAERMGVTWDQAIMICREKKILLEQKNFCSDHELNQSIGAIIRLSLESLRIGYEAAAALFRLLVYLDVSCIPLELLYKAKNELEIHFKRPWTYTRGSTLTTGSASPASVDQNQRSIIKRLKRFSDFPKRSKPRNPNARVDSSTDSALQSFWDSQHKCLQEVLGDPIYIKSAIDVLVDAGLVKRTGKLTIWIHDLFAELTQALIELDSIEDAKLNAHLTSTMVYLTFPTLDSSKPTDTISSLLPHAISAQKSLKDLGILNDATVGAELSHIIASSLLITQRPKTTEDFSKAIDYYTQACTAYQTACERCKATGITWKHIVSETVADWAIEHANSNREPVDRYLVDYERLGRSAHWRMINTCAKLGTTFLNAGMQEQALRCLTIAVNWYEMVFGLYQWDTIDLLGHIVFIHNSMGNHETAHEVAIKRVKAYTRREKVEQHRVFWWPSKSPVIKSSAGSVNSIGTAVTQELGSICLKAPGREREAIKWFEIQLIGRERMFGENSPWCAASMQNVATAYDHAGDKEACIYWWARSLNATLEDIELSIWYTEGDEGWKKTWYDDIDIAKTVARFRELTTDISDLPPELESYIWVVESRAKLWERWRVVREEERQEKAHRVEEEGDEYDREVELFQDQYPQAQKVSYNELIALFECYKQNIKDGGQPISFEELGKICVERVRGRRRR